MFAKWFGGRNEEHDDEPARYATPPVSQNASAPRPQSEIDKKPALRPAAPKKGFDPYNSGAFERRNAWERVLRR